MSKERKSDIEVEVIDFEQICKDIRPKITNIPAEATIGIHGAYGIVRTKAGTFMLDSEGTGNSSPLEAEPFDVDIFRTDGMYCMPSCQLPIKKCHIAELPIKEKVNLAKFIRSFGARLEANFWKWNEILSNLEVVTQESKEPVNA